MNKYIGNLFKGDKAIWMVLFFLCIISIVEVFSALSILTFKSHDYMGPMLKHIFMIAAGVFVAVVTLNIPCRFFKIVTPFTLLLTVSMLLWVLLFGERTNDGARWLGWGSFTFQPSELAKGTLVLATAQILAAMQREDGSGAYPEAIKYVLVVAVPIVGLIGIENLSTAALLFAVVLMMMFIGRIPMIQMGKLMGVLTILGVVFVSLVLTVGSMDKDDNDQLATQTELVDRAVPVDQQEKKETKDPSLIGKLTHRFGTWRHRLLDFFAPDENVTPETYDLGKNFQVGHANIAIASSGIIGKGPGHSTERDLLPQAFADFIYAIIIEEMGIVGAIVVMFLYIILLYRVARIAGRLENNFPAFLIMGLSLLLVLQASMNMMVAVGLMPVTGQPLPLISKGGTSTIINCVYIGVILSVSRSAKRVNLQIEKA